LSTPQVAYPYSISELVLARFFQLHFMQGAIQSTCKRDSEFPIVEMLHQFSYSFDAQLRLTICCPKRLQSTLNSKSCIVQVTVTISIRWLWVTKSSRRSFLVYALPRKISKPSLRLTFSPVGSIFPIINVLAHAVRCSSTSILIKESQM